MEKNSGKKRRKRDMEKRLNVECPCGTKVQYSQCCYLYHAQEAVAPTAEKLMRSRYSAFVYGEIDYLRATWHPDTRPSTLTTEKGIKWLQLIIREQYDGKNNEAFVRFEARFSINGKADKLKELSRFQRIDGAWYYYDGQFEESI